MILQLDTPIEIKIREHNKVKETIKVFLRDHTREEEKKFEKTKKKFEDLVNKTQRLSSKSASVERKLKLYEEAGDTKKAIKMAEESDRIIDELSGIVDEVNALGGDDFYEKLSKESFNILVSGEEKDKLIPYAEQKGYTVIMRSLREARADVEKKQSGE